MYLNIDDDPLYLTEENHVEEDILEEVANKRSCADGNYDLERNSDLEQTVTHTAARRAVQVLEC